MHFTHLLAAIKTTTTLDEELQHIKQYLSGRKYREHTIKLYLSKLKNLFLYYPKTSPQEISKQQILAYSEVLLARKSSYSTMAQYKSACRFYFVDLLKKDYSLNAIKLPARKFGKPECLTQTEALCLIDVIENIKHKTIVTLLYSCGLETEELINIRVRDVVTKQNKLILKNYQGDVKRHAYLPSEVIEIIKEYWDSLNPKPNFDDYFFQGQRGGKYSKTSVRNVCKDNFAKAELNSDLTPRALRRSYIDHMVKLGAPLISVLENLDINSWESHTKYNKFINGEVTLNYTPFNRIIVQSKYEDTSLDKIEKLAFRVTNFDERDYIFGSYILFKSWSFKSSCCYDLECLCREFKNKVYSS